MRYLLVDRIEELTPQVSVKAWKNVAMSEDYLEWHFPERPIVPGTLVLEALSQLAGWHEAATSEFSRWVLLDRVWSARYFGFAVPGDRIDLRLEIVASADPERRAYRGESSVGGERKALLEFEAKVVPLETLDGRERVERAYKQLRGERLEPAKGRART